MHIWHSLPRPFLVLAPLEGATDTVFRQIVASCAKPDLFFTEFTSAEGFCSAGKERVADNVVFTPNETPIIAQIWGKDPAMLYQTARELSGMGFSGIDINMGCPDRAVVKSGCGAAMIDAPAVAREAIDAVKRGAGGLPVSVKTRIGNTSIETDRWITFLLEQGIDALTVHGRTAKELSRVPAHWDEIGKAVAIRNEMTVSTAIIGNGDVKDVKEAKEKYEQYGVDGIMIGRGIFHNPWAFDRSGHVGTTQELLDVMERHITLFNTTWGSRKNYAVLKRFYKIYVSGFPGATRWRERFMATNSAEEALEVLSSLRASEDGSRMRR